jgi:hypothetical protein
VKLILSIDFLHEFVHLGLLWSFMPPQDFVTESGRHDGQICSKRGQIK